MRTRNAAVSAGLVIALLASPVAALAEGAAAGAAEAVVVDRADFYDPLPEEDAVAPLAASRTLVQISDEMKYFTKYESHGNYDQGFSRGDGYNALGYYQFDRRFSLVPFLRYCLSYDAEKYAMLEAVVERADEVSDGSVHMYEDDGPTELGELVEGAWHAAYAADPAEFSLLQDNYAYDSYYLLSERYLASRGIDMSGRADCVKGLVWSMTNLFGSGGVRWFLDEAGLSDDMSDREFVNALVDAVVDNVAERYPSQSQYHEGWIRRYESERADCLAMLPAEPAAHGVSVTGATGGAIRVSGSSVAAGATVTVTLAPDEAHVARGVTVVAASGEAVAVRGSGTSFSFVMPDSDVTVSASFSLRYPDVRPGDWFAGAVSWASAAGLFGGNTDGTFAPNRDITRAEMAGVLYNRAGQPDVDTSGLPRDCIPGWWYEDAVCWALRAGAFNGNPDGTFSPEDPLTREQAAAVIMNMAGALGQDTSARADLSRFPDAGEVSPWFADAMSWAVAEGIISGSDHDGARWLDPQVACTRAVVAAIMMNWLEG